jgi:enoyl-CoA hydratase/carnithine racemase
MLARSACHHRRFEITLCDPARRNALGEAMFASLHERLLVAALAADDRLSRAVRALRSLPVPIVAEVRGTAAAGGCALLAGCDFVVVAPDAQLGYPVHRIGVSPAVTLPALTANAGHGSARRVALGGDMLDGPSAVRAGLATHCAPDAASLAAMVDALADSLAAKGPEALRATKRWLNELDGSTDEVRHLHAERASAAAAAGDEFAAMLRAFWAARSVPPVTPR